MFCKPLPKISCLIYFQFWFYLDLPIFVFWSSPHCDGNCYAEKLKNPHMRKTQQKLKNQHAANRPLQYGINGLLLEVMASRHFSEQNDFGVREKLPVGIRKFILPLPWYHSYVQKVSFLCYFCNWKVLSIDIEWKNVFFVKWAFL